ncbi:MAG: HAD family hydrolase [Lachnospiraceae bacterium]|nr:HAD family hydrolase [Lachnospiraceae bacterium]
MKTLYVSDLDGTLLQSNETLSEYTVKTINELVEQGMIFSYATARSYITAKKVTKGLEARIPLIVYNGAFVIDNVTGEILLSNYFDDSVKDVLDDLISEQIYPIVYAYINDVEKFSYAKDKCTRGMKVFLDSRKGDVRENAVDDAKQLYEGNVFYLTCIDEEEKLEVFYEKYKDQYHCVYQKDIYSGEQWLEIMPKTATKANGIAQLKELLQCEKLVVFGDGKNDIDMFEMADETYAVENAVEELKSIATQVIGNNNEDGVAKWLCGKIMMVSNR